MLDEFCGGKDSGQGHTGDDVIAILAVELESIDCNKVDVVDELVDFSLD